MLVGILLTPFFNRGEVYVDAHGQRYDQTQGFRIPIVSELPKNAINGMVLKIGETYYGRMHNDWTVFQEHQEMLDRVFP